MLMDESMKGRTSSSMATLFGIGGDFGEMGR